MPAMPRVLLDRGAETRYPVKDGEVWHVGPHFVAAGDLTRGDLQALFSFLDSPPLQMVYIDPPYTSSSATSSRAAADTVLHHQTAPVRFAYFARVLLSELKAVAGCDIFMEMGLGSARTIEQALAETGARTLNRWGTTYYRKYPSHLWRFRFSPGGEPMPAAALEGLDDEQSPARAIQLATRRGDTVLDCVFGNGLTAVAAQGLGRRFIGLELNPQRVSVTLTRLTAAGDRDPQRVGTYR
jgi:hypothetical protein